MDQRTSHQVHLVDARPELMMIEEVYRKYLDPNVLAEYNNYIITRHPRDVITYFSADYVEKAITLELYRQQHPDIKRLYRYNDALMFTTNNSVSGSDYILALTNPIKNIPHEIILEYIEHVTQEDLDVLERMLGNIASKVDMIVEYWPGCLYRVDVISSGVIVVEKGEDIHQARYKEVCEFLRTQKEGTWGL